MGGLEEGGGAGSEIALSPPIRSAAFKKEQGLVKTFVCRRNQNDDCIFWDSS